MSNADGVARWNCRGEHMPSPAEMIRDRSVPMPASRIRDGANGASIDRPTLQPCLTRAPPATFRLSARSTIRSTEARVLRVSASAAFDMAGVVARTLRDFA